MLTLEPLLEAVREGIEGAGWTLSGLQKTTSHEFEGRWAGESTRSAFVFFHRDEEPSSVDVYLDETSRGLQGNLALVAELHSLRELPPLPEVLEGLAVLAGRHLPSGYHTPVSLRLRLPDAGTAVEDARLEGRIKLRIPRPAIEAGASAVSTLSAATIASFESLLADPGAAALLADVSGT
jgi:hypothetical protein